MFRFLRRIKEFLYCHVTLMLYRLFAKNVDIGNGTSMRSGFYLRPGLNAKISIGGGCFFNRYFSANAYNSISIGSNCIFGENVKIYDHNHKHALNGLPFKEQGFVISSVEIGDNVWIGSNSIILQSVTIGSNSVIGAGVVVYKDVPPGSVVVADRGMKFIE